MYTWEAAKKACPSGWRLPTRDEWGALARAAGGTGDYGASGTAGKALKSTSGWWNNRNGTDDFGFSALPGGQRSSGGDFAYAGYRGLWWTATENSVGAAYYRYMYYNYDDVNSNSLVKSGGLSVRCLKD
jgi:uncharacterized protein (TIGR02145 family)